MQAVLPPELLRVALIGALTAGFACAPRPAVIPAMPRITHQRRAATPTGGGKPTPLLGWLAPLFA